MRRLRGIGKQPSDTFYAIVGDGSAVCGLTTAHKLARWGTMTNMPPPEFVTP